MRYGAKILFHHVSLQFNPGCHYGLVGANGSGKSTFIKILAGEITPEKGDIQLPNQYTIGTLKQDHYLYENEDILSVVLRGRPALWDALEKKKALLDHHDSFTEEECLQLEKIEHIISEHDGYTAPSEAAKLLEGLGIRNSLHEQPLKILSGGYKLRVLLAKLLFGNPDILVLDEPTNHLDLFSIKWLEGYLKDFAGTLIISSHDRHFLNSVCTHIVDVDFKTIKIYKGNYDAFVEQKQLGWEQKEALLEKQEKRRDNLQGFIDRFGAKASKARQAQSKARIVEKIEEEMESLDLTPSSRLYPNIAFQPYRPSGAAPLVVKEISKSYGTKKVLDKISFELDRGDRIAILGPNGIGKSTLLEILSGKLSADQGTFQWGHAARIGYFPQDHAREVSGSISLLDWLGNVDSTMPQEKLRNILGMVLFSGDAVKLPVSTLSGGEVARLILAKMIMQNGNILLFDEPTNHLDMEAIEELCKAILQFDETVIIVSHNRYFVSKIANRILEITEDGVKDFRCSYEEYVEKREQDLLSQPKSLKARYNDVKTSSSESYTDQKKQRNQMAHLKKKMEQAEEECHKLEKKLKDLEAMLGSEDFYQKNTQDQQQELFTQKEKLDNLLEAAMEKWEQASLQFQQES